MKIVNENLENVKIDEVKPVENPTMAQAIDSDEKAIKKIKDAAKEVDQKIDVDEKGKITGDFEIKEPKKTTSPDLKKMKLSEELFEDIETPVVNEGLTEGLDIDMEALEAYANMEEGENITVTADMLNVFQQALKMARQFGTKTESVLQEVKFNDVSNYTLYTLLVALKDAFYDVVEKVEQTDGADADISTGYPFDASLDEVANDVANWVNGLEGLIESVKTEEPTEDETIEEGVGTAVKAGGKFIANHWKEILAGLEAVGVAADTIKEILDKIKDEKTTKDTELTNEELKNIIEESTGEQVEEGLLDGLVSGISGAVMGAKIGGAVGHPVIGGAAGALVGGNKILDKTDDTLHSLSGIKDTLGSGPVAGIDTPEQQKAKELAKQDAELGIK